VRRLRARRAGAIACLLCLLLPAVAAGAGPSPAPLPGAVHPAHPLPTILAEVSTGQVLEADDPHRRLPPASLSKLMTLYLTLSAIREGHLTLETPVTVSASAWRIGRTPGSSRMFLNAGDVVTVDQLLEGLMVASGNDAAEALAEAVAGSAEQFVTEMNATAAHLGMRDTHFASPHGLPGPDEYTSAWDMAVLARQILLDHPDVVRYSSPRYEIYGGIRQANWNNLVFRDPRVDGLKTGHTAEAGFSIVATERRGAMRLVAVVMDAPTLQERTHLAERLLDTGFAGYALVPVPWQHIVPASLPVYGGTAARLAVEPAAPVLVLLPRDAHPALAVSEEITVRPFAPISQGHRVGVLTVSRGESVLLTVPLVAAATITRGGVPTRMWGILRYTVGGLVHHRRATWRGTYTPPG
jgi:serine-type D-Ala-D-Ala carboxypeptidase (penicillin-binding protein 5/6)